ncbi:MAG: hypothetical protein ACJASK_000764 [Ilumatobacter sp.]
MAGLGIAADMYESVPNVAVDGVHSAVVLRHPAG